MTHRRPCQRARLFTLSALASLTLQAHAVDWQSAPSSVTSRTGNATTAASGAPQDQRRAPALAGAGAAGQIRSNVEQALRLDSLRTQATYDPRWVPTRRLGDAVVPDGGGIGLGSSQVARRAVVASTAPDCLKQRGMNDRITLSLAPNFRIKSVTVIDDVQANPEAATLAGKAATFRVSGPHSFEVQPAAWAAFEECLSRYSIASITVVGPEGFDPYTGRAKPPGPR